MKKPAAARKKMKKRSACIKRPSSVARVKAWRENAARNKSKRKKENVLANARRAARNGLPYQTKWPELEDVAAAAYAAEAIVKSTEAMNRADSAHEAAASAHEAADEAKKEAAYAHTMAIQNSKRIISLEAEVKIGSKTLAETAARAKRNEERLNTDDRKRGYLTPERRH